MEATRFAIQVVAIGIVKDRSFKRLTSLNDLVKLEAKIRMEKFLLLNLAGIFHKANPVWLIFLYRRLKHVRL